MGTVRDLWLRWKMLRLPWRKKFFVGQDLSGNTFWEFRDPLNPLRLRRIVHKSHYVRSSASGSHYADISITPQWHQWLRQARLEAPTLGEQQADVARQVMLKENARLADQRWEAKKRWIEKPTANPREVEAGRDQEEGRTMLATDTRAVAGRTNIETGGTQRDDMPGVMSAVDNVVEIPDPKPDTASRTAHQPEMQSAKETTKGIGPSTTSAPGQKFEPEAWSPGSVRRR